MTSYLIRFDNDGSHDPDEAVKTVVQLVQEAGFKVSSVMPVQDASCAIHIFTAGHLSDVMDVLMVITADGIPFVNSATETFGCDLPDYGPVECAAWIEAQLEKWLGMPPSTDTFRPKYLPT